MATSITSTATETLIGAGSNPSALTITQTGLADYARSGANNDITSLGAISSINGGALGGFRNKLINGDMRISQRGSLFTNPNGVYTLDRWIIDVISGNGASWRVDANQDITDWSASNKILRYAVTTVGSQTYADIRQHIENVGTLQGKQVTLSFYARAGTVGKVCQARIEQNFGSGGSALEITFAGAAFTVSTAAEMTRYSFTFNVPSIQGKTIGTNNSLIVCIRLFTPNGGDFVDITKVQLEEGPVATLFEQRPYGLELELCRRYFQRGLYIPAMVASGTLNAAGQINFVPTMRSTPTCTLDGVYTIANGTAAVTQSSTTMTATANPYKASINLGAFSGLAANSVYITDAGSNGISASAEF